MNKRQIVASMIKIMSDNEDETAKKRAYQLKIELGKFKDHKERKLFYVGNLAGGILHFMETGKSDKYETMKSGDRFKLSESFRNEPELKSKYEATEKKFETWFEETTEALNTEGGDWKNTMEKAERGLGAIVSSASNLGDIHYDMMKKTASGWETREVGGEIFGIKKKNPSQWHIKISIDTERVPMLKDFLLDEFLFTIRDRSSDVDKETPLDDDGKTPKAVISYLERLAKEIKSMYH